MRVKDAYGILMACVLGFSATEGLSRNEAEVIRRHSKIERTEEMSVSRRETSDMSILMMHFQNVPSAITDLGLAPSDAAAVELLSVSEDAFEASLREASQREMKIICSWGGDTDAIVLASAVMAVDEAIANKRTARYQTLLQTLSVEGRTQIKKYLQATVGTGSSSNVDLVSLAAERPDIVRGGMARRCAELAKPQSKSPKGQQNEIVASQQEDQP